MNRSAIVRRRADKLIASRSQLGSMMYPAAALVILGLSDFPRVDTAVWSLLAGLLALGVSRQWIARQTVVEQLGGSWRRRFAYVNTALALLWGGFCLLVISRSGDDTAGTLAMLSTVGIAASVAINYGIVPILANLAIGAMAAGVLTGIVVGMDSPVPWLIIITMVTVYLLALASRLGEQARQEVINATLLESKIDEAARLNLELVDSRNEAMAASETKSSILANVSHELRTPLNSIIGTTELLLLRRLDDDLLKPLSDVHGDANQLLNMLNNLLNLSRLEAAEPEDRRATIDLYQQIKHVVRLHATAAIDQGLSLDVKIVDGVPRWINHDPLQFDQVFSNIIGNSIKYTDAGSIAVNVSTVEEPDGFWVIVSVTDTGVGIAADKLEHIFEPFHQIDSSNRRRHGGVGLGLAITKRLVANWGGAIKVESTPDVGTWFEVRWPVEPVAKPATTPRISRRFLPQEHSTIPADLMVLAIDDNLANLRVLEKQLEYLDVRYRLATGADEALLCLDSTEVDLVLLDCQMPEMDGFSLSRLIRSRADHVAGIPIIACTALADEADRRRCEAAGMDDLLQKPLRLGTLRETLEKWSGVAHVDAESDREDMPARELVEDSLPSDEFDEDRISELVMLTGDDQLSLEEILGEVRQALGQANERMVQYRRSDDAEALAGQCHDLKGVLANVGLSGAAAAYAELERDAHRISPDSREEKVARCADMASRSLDTLWERLCG